MTTSGPLTIAAPADLAQWAGRHLGYSDWMLIDQARIDRFAEATGDRQWIHVDPERAAGGPFGATVAHGFLTLSLIPTLVAHVYRVENASVRINYGLEKVRFPTPVRVDSRLRAGVELLNLEQAPSGWRSTTRVTLEIEGGQKPACVAETLGLIA